jgi:hypothetical protein
MDGGGASGVSDDLVVALTALDGSLTARIAAGTHARSEAESVSLRLDAAMARARALADVHGVSITAGEHSAPTEGPNRAAARRVDWDELVADAQTRLAARGVDPAEVQLDALLDPENVATIEQRFEGAFTLHASLDKYDVTAAICAGLAAALVDFLLVRIPKDTLFRNAGLRDQFVDRGSPLTKWMQSHSLPHNNPLSDLCKTPYDRVNLKHTGQELPGSGGKTHRYHTLGHDPLLGLVFGTIDILTGGLSGIDGLGRWTHIANAGPAAAANPLEGFIVEALHVLSDAFTTMGVPAPGWVATGALQFGSVGRDDLTVAATARQMYVAGYDSRHFLTMATSPAAAELVLRAYWGIRRTLDAEFSEDVKHQALVADANRVAGHPRFQAMALVAHTIGAAANAGKIACYGPSGPLAFNYAQWLAFLKSLLAYGHTKSRSPSDVITGHARANAALIAEGWPEMTLGADAPTLS